MNESEAETRRVFAGLAPGDRVEVLHEVKVGLKIWETKTVGEVVRTDRRRHGLHRQRNSDDKVYSDVIVLRLDGGDSTTVAVDEFTRLRKLAAAANAPAD